MELLEIRYTSTSTEHIITIPRRLHPTPMEVTLNGLLALQLISFVELKVSHCTTINTGWYFQKATVLTEQRRISLMQTLSHTGLTSPNARLYSLKRFPTKN